MYVRDRFSIESIFFRTLYRRPTLQHSLSPLRSFRDPRRSVPESSCARGMRRSEPALKPRNEQRSNEILTGGFTAFSGLFPLEEIIAPDRHCLSAHLILFLLLILESLASECVFVSPSPQCSVSHVI